MEFGEAKSQRQNRWSRRKAHKSRDQKQGYIPGNPRYNGKGKTVVLGNPSKYRNYQPDAA